MLAIADMIIYNTFKQRSRLGFRIRRIKNSLWLHYDVFKTYRLADYLQYLFLSNNIYFYRFIASARDLKIYVEKTVSKTTIYLPFYYEDVPLVYRNKL